MIGVVVDPPGLIGPRIEKFRDVAQVLYGKMDEVNQLARQQGQLHQDARAEKYEWCRLVAMLIEDSLIALN